MAFDAQLARAIGLTAQEQALFRRLSTPVKIQDFLTAMPINLELEGDTCASARVALRRNRCHCIEAAFIASAALLLHGQPALVMDFQSVSDDDHVLTLFRRDGHWGAISKSNSIWLRWRDPVYASARELAMSYFHEYAKNGRKSLRRVSRPFNLGAYDPAQWLTAEEDCWAIAAALDSSPHVPLISAVQARRLRMRENFERDAAGLREYRSNGELSKIPGPT